MSIRLRLTLLYSAILVLTLVLFGAALYLIQARATLDALKRDLQHSSERLAVPALLVIVNSPGIKGERPALPPLPFDQFSSEQAFQGLREREIARILDANGVLVASPYGAEQPLPLSAAGLKAVQAGQEWWETGLVGDEPALVYSRPLSLNGTVLLIVQVARPLTERLRSLQSLGLTLMIASLLVTLAAFGVGWLLAGVSLRPIQRITQTAQAIGSERDFTRRVAYQGPPDELGRLAVTLNGMLAALQDAYQAVGHSLEMQRNFVADVSHELRTPLTTLRGNLGLLRRKPPLPAAEQEDILGDMVGETDRLMRLINDLLVLARADAAASAAHSLAREALDLHPILEEACRQAGRMEAARPIRLDSAAGVEIIGDRDAVRQALLIRLDNAIKHTRGAVHVRAARQGAQALVEVQDEGPGLAPEALAHVFDRFYRSESAVASLTPGFGLGLPIAKALVEAMGGAIEMRSQPEGGSTVSIRLPAAD